MKTEFNWTGKTIVIADDDTINTELLSIILKKTSATIVVFENGQQVVDYISENNADIVILDIQMPILDGFETSLKISESNCKAYVFAFTALNANVEMHKYEAAKFTEVIEKPIRRIPFLNLIDKYINM